MTAAERAQALLMARALRAAATLDWLSTGLTLLSVAAILFGPLHRVIAGISVIIGVVAKLYAMRIAFDARLFEDLGEERLSLGELDSALIGLGLVSADRSGRALPDRCRGARRLIGIAGALLIAQIMVLGLALFAG